MDDQRDYAEEQANAALMRNERELEIKFERESSRTNVHSIRIAGHVWGVVLETATMLEIHEITDTSMWMVGETKSWAEAEFIIREYIAEGEG